MARWRMTAERGSLWMSELAGLSQEEIWSVLCRAHRHDDISWRTVCWLGEALDESRWPAGSLEAAAQAIVDGRR